MYRRLWHQARPHALPIAALLLLGLLASPLALLAPLPLKIAVDSGIGSHPLPGVLNRVVPEAVAGSPSGVVLLAAGLAVLVALFSQLQALGSKYLRSYAGERMVLAFRAQLFHHAQRISLSYHDSQGTADSLYRIHKDAPALQDIVIDGFLPFVTSAFTLAAMVYVTARIDATLALVAIAIAPPLFLVLRSHRRRLRTQAREVRKLESGALAVVQEVLGALRVVRAFGQEVREEQRFLHRSGQGMRARLRLALAEGRFNVVVSVIAAVGTAAVLVLGVRHVQAGVLTLGELLLVMGYLAQLYEPIKTLSKKVATMQGHLASAERAFGLLDEAPGVSERPDARAIARARGAVAFQHVSFGYGPDRPVLRDLSFAIQPGTRLGIVGTTGAGKSTIISLLTRLYDPTAGRVLLDGVDLRDYRLEDLRRQFSLVLQDSVLFATSIAENIAYARPEATRQEIVAAAEAANAHEFIVRLPQGYDTQVGERGVQLSGGQRQRIALARAFLKNSPILILDEPTSAVDAETEAAILEATKRLIRGRTVIIITHRATLLTQCDALLAIENGQIVTDTTRAAPLPATAQARRGATAAALERRRASLLAHPAVEAWAQLTPERVEPVRLRSLKLKPGRVRKTPVYLLEGVGPGGSSVVAKRCRQPDAMVERLVYAEILAGLPLPRLEYFGCVEDPGGEYSWLFLSQAVGEEYSPLLAEHRAYAARWLALLHTQTADAPAGQRLPDGAGDRYLDHLRAARERIQRHLGNPVLSADDLAFLEALLHRLDGLEAAWSALVEEVCHRVPRTLVHGDFVAKNLRIRVGVTDPPLAAFDWEDAGWGVPAADLAQSLLPTNRLSTNPDLDVYWAAVRDRWPALQRDTVTRLGVCGTVFRSLAALNWETHNLAHDWAEWAVTSMRLYEADLLHALERLGAGRPRSPAHHVVVGA